MSHRIHQDLTNAVRSAGLISVESGVARVHGKHLGNLIVSGATSLDNVSDGEVGTVIFVRATNTAPLTNRNGTPIDTLASGDARAYQAISTSTWKPLVGAETAADLPIADAGSVIAATNVEAALQEIALALAPVTPTNTAISTVGNGTLTAAAIVGGLITRTGSTAAYTDTTATEAEINTALGGEVTDQGWWLVIRNTVAFDQTITGGDGVTVSGNAIVPGNSVGLFYCVNAGSNSIVITGVGAMPQCRLKNYQFNTTAAASPVTPAAKLLTGANEVFYEVTTDGAFSLVTRTAAELYGDIPNCHVGFSYLLTIINRGNSTITISPGSNVTMAEATIATLLTQTYLVTFTSATAATAVKVRTGTTPT
jgi:hypothetical protein